MSKEPRTQIADDDNDDDDDYDDDDDDDDDEYKPLPQIWQ